MHDDGINGISASNGNGNGNDANNGNVGNDGNHPDDVDGLTRLSVIELERLRVAIERDDLGCPFTTTDLSAAHFDEDLKARARCLSGLGKEASLAALRVALAERAAQARNTAEPELVWTGPNDDRGTGRDTGVLLRELFEQARVSVLVCGYSFDHGETLLEPLYRAMVQHNVRVDLVINLPRCARDQSMETHLAIARERFLASNWPFGAPHPRLLFDPRTVQPDAVSSIHAKLVVVDRRFAFITSANFTDRGQTRNLECGVCFRHEPTATAMLEHFRRLTLLGLLKVL
ncbi:MAG: phospholipase [Deltaproteobacteria bacterium]|nr:phospholipase [Deltaproteobacteria bacterium]